MARFKKNKFEELHIRCDALRGLLYAEFGFDLEEIAAVESAALREFEIKRVGRTQHPAHSAVQHHRKSNSFCD